jgi:hypothetical protein
VTDFTDLWLDHLAKASAFETIRELFEADEAGSLDDEQFDSCLWHLVSPYLDIEGGESRLPRPVILYYASRRMEFDVGNGGFAQAAYNMFEWLPAAADGYEAMELPRAAALIRQAEELAAAERGAVGWLKRRGAGVSAIFGFFRKSRLSELDHDLVSNLDAVGWWAQDARLRYVRQNRDAFRSLESQSVAI